MSAVVLIDDDSEGCLLLARGLKAAGLTAPVHAATTAKQGWALIRSTQATVAVVDLSLEESRGVASGYELLSELNKSVPHLRVIVLTGHSDTRFGVEALQRGAASFLGKPADIPHLCAIIRDNLTYAALRSAVQQLTESSSAAASSRLVGASAAMQRVREQVAFAASTNQPVFLRGETGVGKGVCALAIHELSARRRGRFIRYQPSFAGADLTMSDLFGHRRGAFTGAADDRDGLLASADAGTLFLDEIDALPIGTQVALLGVLQEKRYRRIGDDAERSSDFRLITASNQDLSECLRAGKMRQDFYHRVAHQVIEIPPLRARPEDIEPLAAKVLDALQSSDQLGVLAIAPDALNRLREHRWAGNVRELEAVVTSAAYRVRYRNGSQIEPQDVEFQAPLHSSPVTSDFTSMVEEYKRKLIEDALVAAEGNQVKAAELLQLDRSTMRRILQRADR